MVRKLVIAEILITILGMFLQLTLVPALSSSASASSQRRCTRSFTQYHNRNLLDVTIVRTCRHWYRTQASFGGVIKDGPWRISPGTHSVACDVSSCQSHPDGALQAGWVERKDGSTFCLSGISCGTAALRARRP